MKKHTSRLLSTLLVLCMVLALLPGTALAAEIDDLWDTQRISGQVLASELRDGAVVVLTGDTALTLDTDKTISTIFSEEEFDQNGALQYEEYSLTIEGAATLTVGCIFGVGKFTLNSGKVVINGSGDGPKPVGVSASMSYLTVNGGELYCKNINDTYASMFTDEVNISGGRVESYGYAGISTKVMNVSGGEVYLYGDFTGIGFLYLVTASFDGSELNITGGYVELAGIGWPEGVAEEDNWTVGAALSGLSVTGGTLKMTGSLCAVNCWDTPVELGDSVKIQSPAGAYATAEKTDTEQSDRGWSGYSIYNADGSRVTEVTISSAIPDTPGTPVIPAEGTAYPSTIEVELDGKPVKFRMYVLLDPVTGYPTNYVKVRDLALAMDGTKGQFNVGYDEASGQANLESGKSYTTRNGTENNTPFNDERSYKLPEKRIYVDGKPSDLVGFVLTDDAGGDHTYFQLRDLGRKLGFNVGWDDARQIGYIESDKPYTG